MTFYFLSQVKTQNEDIVDGWASCDADWHVDVSGLIPGPGQTYVEWEKVALFCNPASDGTFSNTEIEIIKWVQ
jgi:hypothetical protein